MDADLENIARRQQLADAISVRLEADPRVMNVRPFGSLGRGTGDVYSDIDLRVELIGTTDRAFAEALPTLLEPEGPLLIAGWALAQLPERYGRTLYFEDYPLFWHVDIACESDLHEDGSDLLEHYYPEQIFKIWLEVLAEMLRGQDRTGDLEAPMRRWADLTPFQALEPKAKLACYLELCVMRARSRGASIEPLIARCRALEQIYLPD